MPAATDRARRRSVASAPGRLAPEGPLPCRQVEITHGPGNCSTRRVFPIPEEDRPSAPAHYEDRIWPKAIAQECPLLRRFRGPSELQPFP